MDILQDDAATAAATTVAILLLLELLNTARRSSAWTSASLILSYLLYQPAPEATAMRHTLLYLRISRTSL